MQVSFIACTISHMCNTAIAMPCLNYRLSQVGQTDVHICRPAAVQVQSSVILTLAVGPVAQLAYQPCLSSMQACLSLTYTTLSVGIHLPCQTLLSNPHSAGTTGQSACRECMRCTLLTQGKTGLTCKPSWVGHTPAPVGSPAAILAPQPAGDTGCGSC